MRVYRDLEMVEQLGSGVPRILEYYDENCFIFFPHFIRTVLPIEKEVENKIKLHEVIPEKDLEETLRKLVDETINDTINDPINRSEEHTSELQSRFDLVCSLILE